MSFVRAAINFIREVQRQGPLVRLTRGLPESMILKWVLKIQKIVTFWTEIILATIWSSDWLG